MLMLQLLTFHTLILDEKVRIALVRMIDYEFSKIKSTLIFVCTNY